LGAQCKCEELRYKLAGQDSSAAVATDWDGFATYATTRMPSCC